MSEIQTGQALEVYVAPATTGPSVTPTEYVDAKSFDPDTVIDGTVLAVDGIPVEQSTGARTEGSYSESVDAARYANSFDNLGDTVGIYPGPKQAKREASVRPQATPSGKLEATKEVPNTYDIKKLKKIGKHVLAGMVGLDV